MKNVRAMMWHGARWRGLRGTLGMLAVSLLAATLVTSALATEAPNAPGRVPRPVIEMADGAACVADPAFMRKNHMDLLKHQRDDTMHRGIRAPKFSLTGCVNCHASKKTNSVIASSGNFCQSCHTYAGVSLDCFECHSATPGAASNPARAAPASSISANAASGGKQ